MANPKQIAANKKNSGKSTGPKSKQGKMAVRFNALKHGATAAPGLLPDEDSDEKDQFKNALFKHYAPKDQLQEDLVWLIADGLWRLRRFSRIEAGVLTWHTYEFMRTRLEVGPAIAQRATRQGS